MHRNNDTWLYGPGSEQVSLVDSGFKVKGSTSFPSKLIVLLCEELKRLARDYTGFDTTKAVFTVPAYFNDN